MQKLIIEARVNEYAMRKRNPHVPWTAQEIARDSVACREAGASIVHFHAREENGAPCHDAARYAETIARVHDVCDLLVHPTLGANTLATSKEGRLAPCACNGEGQAHPARFCTHGYGQHQYRRL